jgi:pyruvate-formate lyase-activating enzyme
MDPVPIGQARAGLIAGSAPFAAADGSGSRYVVYFQGCRFDCLTCRNPGTIPMRPTGLEPVTVNRVVSSIVPMANALTGVILTGGEPTMQPEFLEDLLIGLRDHPATAHLERLIETNGSAPLELWDRLVPLVDGVMVDLKAIDAETHLVLTGSGNQRTLAALARLAARGALREVRLLLVPGLNDDDESLTRTARWLLSLDPRITLRVNIYRRHGTRRCTQFFLEAGADEPMRYRAVLATAGVGNLLVG